MKKYSLAINGNPYDVKILEVSAETVKAEVNGIQHTVSIGDIENINMFPTETVKKKPAVAAKPAEAKKSAKALKKGDYCIFGSGNLDAPIPGQIISVDVQAGDEVKKGDHLLILEAMKMENTITATRDSIIKEVLITEGETVTQDQTLIVFE